VVGLSAYANLNLLIDQIEEFHPRYVCVGTKKDAIKLKKLCGNKKIKIYFGNDGLISLASLKGVDTVLIAVVGSAGLYPLVAAIKSKKNIALANKESLVVAGGLIVDLISKHRARLIPVDSEHSAIFQCLKNENKPAVSRLIITASGGPFFNKTISFSNVTVSQALKHPRWRMGKKITIDSATMMNKGLEIIEAHYLFNLPLDRIQILVHPQSIVHSMVEFCDGAILGLLSSPDMRLSIQYALTYPERFPTGIKMLNLDKISRLEFHKPDYRRFPCLKLALEAVKNGRSMPAVMNASDEVAVDSFLKGKINFSSIPKLIKKVMSLHKVIRNPDLEQIVCLDRWAREETKRLI
jgi:1-deoxy-D-xylulose-5-phosphate reductoisomerase